MSLTQHTCNFCGCVESVGADEPNCSTLAQAYEHTPTRPYGCPWFDKDSREQHPKPTIPVSENHGGFANEAEGYAASLRQQATWIDESRYTDDLDSEELLAERAELMTKNAAATSWGAAVGARHERIKGIDRALQRIDESGGRAQGACRSVKSLAIDIVSMARRRDPDDSGEFAIEHNDAVDSATMMLHAALRAPEAADAGAVALKLGDLVKVNENAPYFSDWRDAVLKVVSLRLDPEGGQWVSVIEGSERHRGNGVYDGETTDFNADYLSAIPSTVRCRTCGEDTQNNVFCDACNDGTSTVAPHDDKPPADGARARPSQPDTGETA